MLNLEHYPVAIANAAHTLNDLENTLVNLHYQITSRENAASAEVAFDPTLKNEGQRTVRRHELLEADDVYEDLTRHRDRLLHEKSNNLAHLEQLRNEFSVAKLQVRQAIAQQLTSLEIRELVGV